MVRFWRRPRRWLRRLALGAAALVIVLALPVAAIEGGCRGDGSAASPRSGAQLSLVIDEPRCARREIDSYLSFPEWHIVYAYEDFSAVLQHGNESDFAYGRQIVAFWSSLCGINRLWAPADGPATDTKVMLYTIGWSFTAELALKGAYENTMGRVFEWWRGAEKTAEDRFIRGDAERYARFLRQTPWYAYPFGERLASFWSETPWRESGLARKLERRFAFTLEYGIKAGYAALIGYASAAALGLSDLETGSVVVKLDASDVVADERIRVVRAVAEDRTLIVGPRYRANTEILLGLARRGRNIAEIAGNNDVLVTVLAEPSLAPVGGATPLFSMPSQSAPGRQRVGLSVTVSHLGDVLRTLEARGARIEHIYDY